MPDNWTIEITSDTATRALEEYPSRALQAIRRTLDEQNELTVSSVIEKRLSFNRDQPSTLEGLRVQSGKLRQSFRRGASDSLSTGAKIEGDSVVSTIGSNLRYAGVHEYGFSGVVSVPGHSRRLQSRLSFKFGGKAKRRKVQGRDVFVRPHPMRVNLPARRYIGRTLDERLPAYTAAIESALERLWERAE